MIGTGLMALHHLTTMVGRDDTVVAAMCEPSAAAYDAAARRSRLLGRPDRRTSRTGAASSRSPRASWSLDAVMIVTPHALHFAQASAALEAGLDVLLEKPMVMNATRRWS